MRRTDSTLRLPGIEGAPIPLGTGGVADPTRQRPIPAGIVSGREALALGVGMGVLSFGLLAWRSVTVQHASPNEALSRFADGGIQFELLGVKSTRAFDANIIIVSVAMRGPDGGRRLIGCVIAEDDVLRGAVVAVLSATNRVMGNFVNTREASS